MQLLLNYLKHKTFVSHEGIKFDKKVKMNDVIDTLPFKLTKAQLKVLDEINNDMESDKIMNRLLQGDVGSR
jgi:ATP-dependent DNA helicase RecG